MAEEKKQVDGFLIPLTVEENEDCSLLKGTRRDYLAFMESEGVTQEIREVIDRAEHKLRAKAEEFLFERTLNNDFKRQRIEIPTDRGETVFIGTAMQERRAGIPTKGQSAEDIPKKMVAWSFTERQTIRPDSRLLKDGGQIAKHEEAMLAAWNKKNKK